MLLLWATDIHLNFLGQPHGPKGFGVEVRKQYPDADAIVVTGDIAECNTFKPMLEAFAEGFGGPVWFVLGNHDAYGGSVSKARGTAMSMKGAARWLETEKLVELAPGVALVGQDGWYDARNGDPQRSLVAMSDFIAIREFLGKWGSGIISEARSIADDFSDTARQLLQDAIAKGYKTIYFATHVPPYALAAWHRGKISDAHWLPWMSNRSMGEMLDEVCGEHPDVTITVLCGHTHSVGTYIRYSNLRVLTGHSEYGDPRVCASFVFDEKAPEGTFNSVEKTPE